MPPVDQVRRCTPLVRSIIVESRFSLSFLHRNDLQIQTGTHGRDDQTLRIRRVRLERLDLRQTLAVPEDDLSQRVRRDDRPVTTTADHSPSTHTSVSASKLWIENQAVRRDPIHSHQTSHSPDHAMSLPTLPSRPSGTQFTNAHPTNNPARGEVEFPQGGVRVGGYEVGGSPDPSRRLSTFLFFRTRVQFRSTRVGDDLDRLPSWRTPSDPQRPNLPRERLHPPSHPRPSISRVQCGYFQLGRVG